MQGASWCRPGTSLFPFFFSSMIQITKLNYLVYSQFSFIPSSQPLGVNRRLFPSGRGHRWRELMLPRMSWASDTMMNPSSSDPPRQPDNSSRKQPRSSSPAGIKDSGSKAAQKGSHTSKLITSKQGGGGGGGGRSSRGHSPVSTGRERPAGGASATRGAAAVQAAGAESPTTSRPAADAERGGTHTPEDSPRPAADASSPSRADANRVVSDQPCASKSPKLRSKTPKGGEATAAAAATSGAKKSSKSNVGCGPGFWKEGCLQSELIQFHLNKSLGKKGTKMQAKSASPPASEPELSPEPCIPKPAPQPDQRMQEEMEKLEDENDDLKVNWSLVKNLANLHLRICCFSTCM